MNANTVVEIAPPKIPNLFINIKFDIIKKGNKVAMRINGIKGLFAALKIDAIIKKSIKKEIPKIKIESTGAASAYTDG